MTEKLLDDFEDDIEELVLVPSHGGAFEVEADGQLLYSKLKTGRHAEYKDVVVPLRALLGRS